MCSYVKLLPTRFCRSSRVIRLLFLKTRRFLQICLSAFLQTNICNSHKSNQEGKKDVFSDFVNCPINAPTLCSRSILIMKQVKIICFSSTTSELVVKNVKSRLPLPPLLAAIQTQKHKIKIKRHNQTCKHTLRRRWATVNRKGRAQKHHYLISSSGCPISLSPCSSL